MSARFVVAADKHVESTWQLIVEWAADGVGVVVATMDATDPSTIRGVELTPEAAARIAAVLANQPIGPTTDPENHAERYSPDVLPDQSVGEHDEEPGAEAVCPGCGESAGVPQSMLVGRNTCWHYDCYSTPNQSVGGGQ